MADGKWPMEQKLMIGHIGHRSGINLQHSDLLRTMPNEWPMDGRWMADGGRWMANGCPMGAQWKENK
jgi:hypothetical protein